jgi:hypothetical protein
MKLLRHNARRQKNECTLTLVILVTLLLYFFLEVFYLLSEHHDCEIVIAAIVCFDDRGASCVTGAAFASLLENESCLRWMERCWR